MTVAAVDDFSDPQLEATPEIDQRHAKQASIESEIAPEVQSKISRLSQRLYPALSGKGAGALVFGEVGSAGSSSLWLTTSVASILGSMLGEQVHVLAIRERARTIAGSLPSRSTLEYVSAPGVVGESADMLLNERLQDLMLAKRKVMVHLPDAHSMTSLALSRSNISGFVFLARASQTRKAALESLQAKLGQLEIAVFGAVLLDRVYPIPERLYRLL